MAPYLDYASLIFFAVSAVLWFASAKVRLTKVGFGLDELDNVHLLSADLQKMGAMNFWAAIATGIAVAIQAVTKILV